MDLEKKIIVGTCVLTVAVGICLGLWAFEKPGPKQEGACVLDSRTIRYDTEMWVADARILTTQTAKVGQDGAMFERFVSLETREDGKWRADFENIFSRKTATMILESCPPMEMGE